MAEVLTIATPELGDHSYIVTDGTYAAVIDPQRDIDRIIERLEEQRLTVTDVFETHVHNDYVTGGYELARSTGADYHLPAADEVFFRHAGLRDGDCVRVGSFSVRALHTPGHTPNHLAYVITDADREIAVFTGGSLLYGTVGRTDLVARSLAQTLTRAQYASAQRLSRELGDDVAIYPTHGFGSFCSSTTPDEGSLDGQPSSMAHERRANIALTAADEDAFVEQLLAGLDAYPQYYVHMGPRNRVGPGPVNFSDPAVADPQEVHQRVSASEWVIDVRDRGAFAGAHVQGTINIALTDSFTTYVGWLLPWSTPITLLADDHAAIAEAQRALSRIGIDRPAAAAWGGVDVYGRGLPRGTYRVADFAVLRDARRAAADPLVLDVRRDDERRDGAVRRSVHIPIHELERRIGELPDVDVWVHCASGYRASVAASLLDRAGRRPVLIDDEFGAATELGLTG